LDQALKGESPSTRPAISKDALKEAITNAVMANADIPAEAKQQAIESALQSSFKDAGDTSCQMTLQKATAMYELRDGAPWDRSVLQEDLYTLVGYSADWCSPCHAQKAAVEAYIEERQAQFNWLYVERDAQKLDW
jgi:thiol-disulfide isomerase/thioredoxin